MEIIPLLVVCMLATACLLYIDVRYVAGLDEEDIDGTLVALMFALAVLFPFGLIAVIGSAVGSIIDNVRG